MMPALDPARVERFRGIVADRLGLAFHDSRLDHVAEILAGRVEGTGSASTDAYLASLASTADWSEWRVLAEKLTVPETYFFRYWEHFSAFSGTVLADRLAATGGTREVRILSAGCASGEEPYSLAMLARESTAGLPWPPTVRIIGIDVNPSVLEKAKLATYSAWALRSTPRELRDRYFARRGSAYALDPAIRKMVAFEERNLLDDDPAFWRPSAFDIVFCRNVTMYFSLDVARAVIARIAASLAPGGHLFLGHAETLRGVSDSFHLKQSHGAFYYQLRGSERREAWSLPAPRTTASIPEMLDPGATWVGVIHGASQRVAALTAPALVGAASRPTSPPPEPTGARAVDLGMVIELIRKERLAEALDLLTAMPPEHQEDPDARLLSAAILTNCGEIAKAKDACRQLLQSDELNAGAHYLMALCNEHEGDRRSAIEHDRAASYLDPAFAMPRFHLGLLARRQGDLTQARVAFSEALSLLGREDSPRILLFGGGFSREALVELCRDQLAAIGGLP